MISRVRGVFYENGACLFPQHRNFCASEPERGYVYHLAEFLYVKALAKRATRLPSLSSPYGNLTASLFYVSIRDMKELLTHAITNVSIVSPFVTALPDLCMSSQWGDVELWSLRNQE